MDKNTALDITTQIVLNFVSNTTCNACDVAGTQVGEFFKEVYKHVQEVVSSIEE